jgi:hypothetical protein
LYDNGSDFNDARRMVGKMPDKMFRVDAGAVKNPERMCLRV